MFDLVESLVLYFHDLLYTVYKCIKVFSPRNTVHATFHRKNRNKKRIVMEYITRQLCCFILATIYQSVCQIWWFSFILVLLHGLCSHFPVLDSYLKLTFSTGSNTSILSAVYSFVLTWHFGGPSMLMVFIAFNHPHLLST